MTILRAIGGPTGRREAIEHGFAEPTQVGGGDRGRAAAGLEVDHFRYPRQVEICHAPGLAHGRLATIPSVRSGYTIAIRYSVSEG